MPVTAPMIAVRYAAPVVCATRRTATHTGPTTRPLSGYLIPVSGRVTLDQILQLGKIVRKEVPVSCHLISKFPRGSHVIEQSLVCRPTSLQRCVTGRYDTALQGTTLDLCVFTHDHHHQDPIHFSVWCATL